MSKEETLGHSSAVTDLAEQLSKIRNTVDEFYREYKPQVSRV